MEQYTDIKTLFLEIFNSNARDKSMNPNFVINITWCLYRNINCQYTYSGVSQVVPMVENPPAYVGNLREVGSVAGWGRSLWGGPGNPLQYSCLENPLDRRAWRAMVQQGSERAVQGWSDFTHVHTYIFRGTGKDDDKGRRKQKYIHHVKFIADFYSLNILILPEFSYDWIIRKKKKINV